MTDGRALLVTGGTGFLGAALVPRLIARGYDVHLLVREGSPPSDERAHRHVGDLSDEAALRRTVRAVASRGAGAGIVHAGALISYRSRDAALARTVNVEATRTLLDAARRSGIARFLFVSSVVTVGHAPDERVALDEEADFNGHELRSSYIDTKRAAEEDVLAAGDELDVVVCNPGAVFGPSERISNTDRFLQVVARGRLARLAPPGSLSVVGVSDVAAGIVLALERGARGRRYILTESVWTFRDVFALIARALGAGERRVRVPAPLWSLIAGAATLVDRVRPLQHVTPESLRILGAHFRFDATRARRELGFAPRPFVEVLGETIAWLRSRGELP